MSYSSIDLFSCFNLWRVEDLASEKVIKEIKKIRINPDFFYLELGIADTLYILQEYADQTEWNSFILRGGTCINQVHLPRKIQRFSYDIDFSTSYHLEQIETCFTKINYKLSDEGKTVKIEDKIIGKILQSSQFAKWEMAPQMANITYKRYTPRRIGLEKVDVIDHNIQINNVSKVKPIKVGKEKFNSFIFDHIETDREVFVNSASLSDCVADKIKCLAPFKLDDKYVLGRPPFQKTHIARDVFDLGNVVINQPVIKEEINLKFVLKKLNLYAKLESHGLVKDHIDILKKATETLQSIKDDDRCMYTVNGLVLSREEKFNKTKWGQFCLQVKDFLSKLI